MADPDNSGTIPEPAEAAEPEGTAKPTEATEATEAAATAEAVKAPRHHFELERSAEFSQYLVHGREDIRSLLRTLIQKGALITVYFDQGNAFLLTSMLALSADAQGFILDLGSDDAMNQKALKADRLILTTVLDKVKIQFRVAQLAATEYDGRTAFLGRLPETLLRLQRREFFRLSTPVANPITMNTQIALTPDEVFDLDVPLFDISGGGVGLMATPEQAEHLQRSDVLDECRIVLPDEGVLIARLAIRNRFEIVSRSGARLVRIGCAFVDLPNARLSMVQRYITRIERERKARLSGLA